MFQTRRHSDCRVCRVTRVLARLSLIKRLRSADITEMKSWCRVCGIPVLLRVPWNYEDAIDWAYEVDDMVDEHDGGGHREVGGWGVHWRLDEVLFELFPMHEVMFPTPSWYLPNESMDLPVQILPSSSRRERQTG